ncbi:MAG: hypothetical protein JRI25_10335 [Deltaproteobacteria bacterium]|nr:hypothetical protein [Deltaproteobacteria bacterium]MBW2254980.1 hypothetical protein [Deltaproteobacteria bacterium]
MRRSLCALLALSVPVLLAGCTRDDGVLEISGTLSEAFASGANAARGAEEGAVVDTLVAVPHDRGYTGIDVLEGTLSVPVAPGESFALELDPTWDYMLLLVDERPDEQDCVIGTVAFPADPTQRLSSVPASEQSGDVEAGEVRPPAEGSDEAPAEETVEDVADAFEMTVDELVELASVDDGAKQVVNSWLNWDPEAGTLIQPSLSFNWTAVLEDVDGAGPDSYGFVGVHIGLDVLHPDLLASFEDICDSEVQLAVWPPVEIAFDDGVTYGPEEPLTNSAMQRWDEDRCSGDGIGVNRYTEGAEGLFLAFRPNNLTALPSGWWTFEVDGEELAAFDLGLAMPLADDKVLVPIPIPSITTDNSGAIQSIDLSWKRYDAGAGAWTTSDSRVLSKVVNGSTLVLNTEDGSTSEYVDQPGGVVASATSFQHDWNINEGEGTSLYELTLAYQMGGAQYSFQWRRQSICGNGRIDPGEECEPNNLGSNTCLTLGLQLPGWPTCTEQCTLDTSDCTPPMEGQWLDTGSMAAGRLDFEVTRLGNGSVLITGGRFDDSTYYASAEVYDAGTGQVVPTGSMGTARMEHTATLLLDGRVLVAGGAPDGVNDIDTAEIWDPATGSFTPTADTMEHPRSAHAATLLNDGRVLLTGGFDSGARNTAEIYDPATDTFQPAVTLVQGRLHHTATLLPLGQVLIAGDETSEVYDPGSMTSTAGPARTYWSQKHVALRIGGQVLHVGAPERSPRTEWGRGAELYDPWTNTFTPMLTAEDLSGYDGVVLSSGEALFYGNVNISCGIPRFFCSNPGVYYPLSRTFGTVPREWGSWPYPGRVGHQMAALPDGRALMCGGWSIPEPDPLATCEVFVPDQAPAVCEGISVGVLPGATAWDDAGWLLAGLAADATLQGPCPVTFADVPSGFDSAALSSYEVLLAASTSAAGAYDDAAGGEVDAVTAFVQGGGGLVVTGLIRDIDADNTWLAGLTGAPTTVFAEGWEDLGDSPSIMEGHPLAYGFDFLGPFVPGTRQQALSADPATVGANGAEWIAFAGGQTVGWAYDDGSRRAAHLLYEPELAPGTPESQKLMYNLMFYAAGRDW